MDPIVILFDIDPETGREHEEWRGTAAEMIEANEGDEDVLEAVTAILAGAESADVGGGAAAWSRLRLASATAAA